MHSFVYLASASQRRQELLRQLGIEFRLLLADDDEAVETLEATQPRESARRYVQRVATLKAGAAVLRLRLRGLEPAPILTADTTVALRGAIIGKPTDPSDAARTLQRLSGQTHRVLTAVVVTEGHRLRLALSESRVTMRALSAAEIQAYVACGEPLGKAGSYALQGRASGFISRVAGSPSGIVGLPLCETALLLQHFKVRS